MTLGWFQDGKDCSSIVRMVRKITGWLGWFQNDNDGSSIVLGWFYDGKDDSCIVRMVPGGLGLFQDC